MEENKTLQNLVHDLDWSAGGILCRLETFDDLYTTLNHLRQEMDGKGQKNAMLYFREWSRTIRIMDELMRHSLRELKSEYEKLSDIKDVIFEKVVKEESVLEKGQRPSINSLDGWNYFGMDNNIKTFMKEFGRMPNSFEEVATYINEISFKVRTAHEAKEEIEKADAPTSTSKENNTDLV